VLGHCWTIAGHVARTLNPGSLPAARHVSVAVPDPTLGGVRLSGRHSAPEGAQRLLLLVHGLGGSSQSPYLFPATRFAHEQGVATLRLNLRGADLLGEDFYHAGLTADLNAMLGSAPFAHYREVVLLGYSLGEHLCARYASERPDARVKRVATLCSPLDLSLGADAFDAAGPGVYRHHVLQALKRMYRAVARRRSVPLPVDEAEHISAIRRWDEQIVAPRHGFASAADYYSRCSAAPRLHAIDVPCVFAFTRDDPVVPPHTLRAALQGCSPRVQTWEIARGGHIGYPSAERPPASLGVTRQSGDVTRQLTRWLLD
jgi:predicted alpha/beta-fold hydrolase